MRDVHWLGIFEPYTRVRHYQPNAELRGKSIDLKQVYNNNNVSNVTNRSNR